MKHKTIFVSLASFNEEDLLSTMQNAIATARYPNRIKFGVFYHNTENQFEDLSMYTGRVHVSKSKTMLGVGLSRSLANQFYSNEDYYLQIDAHTIFDNWWDQRLIEELEVIKKTVDKPVISYYLPSWFRLEDDSVELEKRTFNSTLVWDHDQMNTSYWDIPIMNTSPVDWSKEQNVFKRHYGIAAQFIFADGNFCQEMLPDEQIMFYGEEPTLALRCFAAGYKIFVTMNSYMWHKNKIISKNPKNDRFTYEPEDAELRSQYQAFKANGLSRTRKILTGEILGIWGAPTKEVLDQYELEAEFNFKKFYQNMTNREDDGVLWYEQ